MKAGIITKELFTAEYVGTFETPISPVDGYKYSPEELTHLYGFTVAERKPQ